MRWKGLVDGRSWVGAAGGGEVGCVCGMGGGENAGATSLDCDARLKYGFRDSSAAGPGLDTAVASCALAVEETGAAATGCDRALP